MCEVHVRTFLTNDWKGGRVEGELEGGDRN